MGGCPWAHPAIRRRDGPSPCRPQRSQTCATPGALRGRALVASSRGPEGARVQSYVRPTVPWPCRDFSHIAFGHGARPGCACGTYPAASVPWLGPAPGMAWTRSTTSPGPRDVVPGSGDLPRLHRQYPDGLGESSPGRPDAMRVGCYPMSNRYWFVPSAVVNGSSSTPSSTVGQSVTPGSYGELLAAVFVESNELPVRDHIDVAVGRSAVGDVRHGPQSGPGGG